MRILHTESNQARRCPDNLPLVAERKLHAHQRPVPPRLALAPALVEQALQELARWMAAWTPASAVLVVGQNQTTTVSTLHEWVLAQGLAPEVLATALNGQFVPRTQRASTVLRAGDAPSSPFKPLLAVNSAEPTMTNSISFFPFPLADWRAHAHQSVLGHSALPWPRILQEAIAASAQVVTMGLRRQLAHGSEVGDFCLGA